MKFRARELKLFWYWISERHNIYLRKKAKEQWPWTKDKILQQYKFTNVFRQLDRVTEEWNTRYMKLLSSGVKNPVEIFFHCCMFRLFNWPETYDALYYGMGKWNRDKAVKVLSARAAEGKQIFTGAYIIPNAGSTDPKIEVICDALDAIFKDRADITARLMKGGSMEAAVAELSKLYTVGEFIAYEIACDLRFTSVLNMVRDARSWANPGPGARRGIHRLMTGEPALPGKKPDYVQAMRELYKLATKQAIGDKVFACEWPFEMREIEHSLCEFDKYMRVKNGEGRPRSRYVYKPVQLDLWR